MALQVLFELDCTNHDPKKTLQRALSGENLPEETKSLASELAQGVSENRDHLDTLIQKHAPAWPVQQLSAVDRNILRIAIFEVLINNTAPPKAAINEAVDIAKAFGSENIHRFVNGVLGSIMAAIEPRSEIAASWR